MPSLAKLFKRIGDYAPGIATAETAILCDPAINTGRPFTITFARPNDFAWPPPAGYPTIVVCDYFSETVLASWPWVNGAYLGNARVISGTVHIFGTADPENKAGQNSLVWSTLAAGTFKPTAGTIIRPTIPGVAFAYSGPSCNPDGSFSFGYSNQWGYGTFTYPDATFTYAHAVNAVVNHDANPPYLQNMQWGGDGYWYCLTLFQDGAGNLASGMARSSDRVNFVSSATTFLTPTDMPAIEGINNSDERRIEYCGRVYGIYLDGDQATWGAKRTYVFDGTEAELRAQMAW